MARHTIYTVKKRRRREGKTDYRKRLKILSSRKPRLVVRKTNKYIIAQIIMFDPRGDRVIASAHSGELEKYGWKLSKKNMPAAYLLGLLIARKAEGKVNEAILDIGLYPAIHGSRIFAVAKGAIDGGLNINIGEEVLPREDRIKGQHIAKYYESNPDKFNNYKKMGLKPGDIEKMFEEAKKKIGA